MFFRLVVSHVSFLSCLAWCLPWCLVFTTVCDLATAQENSERSVTLDKDAIRELTQQFCERRKVPGLSLAIAQDGELRLAEGFGFADLEHQVKTTAETKFRTASIAKPITAVLLMRLVAEGKLNLDQPVQLYCSGYPEKQWPVTVRQVMGHLGGVRHYKSSGEASSTDHYHSLDAALETFASDPLLHQPGSKYLYSSFGYNLLGSVAEGVGQQSFYELLKQEVLEPVGMPHTIVDDSFAIIPHRSSGYQLADQRTIARLPKGHNWIAGEVYNSSLHDTSMKIPGGGLLSTPTDLVLLGQALLGDDLLATEQKTEMWTVQETLDGQPTGYGLGWRVGQLDGRKAYWHTGGQSGTSTVLVLFPDSGISIAVMCNLQGTNVTSLVNRIARQQQW